MIKNSIEKRLNNIEQILKQKKDYTMIIGIQNRQDNNYYIWSITNGIKTEFIYDDFRDFIRDKDINIKDEKTFIRCYKDFSLSEV